MAINDVEHCEVHIVHKELVDRIGNEMPSDDELYDLAELFKVFGDSTRIKILFALFESEMCVCDIANLLNMTKSSISHQLKVLKDDMLVKSHKVGKEVYYSLNDEHVKIVLEIAIEHIIHKERGSK